MWLAERAQKGALIGSPAQNRAVGLGFAKRRVTGASHRGEMTLGVGYGGVEVVVVVSRAGAKGGPIGSPAQNRAVGLGFSERRAAVASFRWEMTLWGEIWWSGGGGG